MRRAGKSIALMLILGGGLFVAAPGTAQAQVVVGAPVAPAVGFVPVRRGLFGLRTGFVPVVAQPA
ncbi:MAG: hypothetical protein HKN13_02295, partial [Rhodothermales bacterium]|nr:hypothetical protein [Rhodothermales bacterium]